MVEVEGVVLAPDSPTQWELDEAEPRQSPSKAKASMECHRVCICSRSAPIGASTFLGTWKVGQERMSIWTAMDLAIPTSPYGGEAEPGSILVAFGLPRLECQHVSLGAGVVRWLGQRLRRHVERRDVSIAMVHRCGWRWFWHESATRRLELHSPFGKVLIDGDCNDNEPDMFPGAPSTTQGVDNDCSGGIEPLELSECPGDFNGDGLRNTSDLLIMLSNFGCEAGCLTSMDSSDDVDIKICSCG